MKLASLIESLPVRLARGNGNVDIANVVEDSRQVTQGSLFVARPGTKAHGRAFVKDATARGAAAVLAASDDVEIPDGLPLITSGDLAAAALAIADRLYGDPNDGLTLLGVTGTNGKSTTTWLIQQMLSAAGRRCGLVSTTRIDDGLASREAAMTTPGSLELRGVLAAMRHHRCSHAAVEVSSHGIDQKRIEGLRFAAAVFTNLSGDHLDYHKTMDAYADVKGRLFAELDASATAVVNGDDPATDRMLQDCRANVLRCSVRDRTADCVTAVLNRSVRATRVQVRGPWGSFEVETPLIGAHNMMNLLEAAAACSSVGVGRDALQQAAESAQAPPGRLEVVTARSDPFTVLVDYSHTDGALEAVLSELKPLVPKGGRLRTLFGCGGDRDRTKRPRMAVAALRFSHDVIVTSDNPRTERPETIIDEILAGVPAGEMSRVIVEVDRRRAIDLAIKTCRERDVLVIAGKGHETYQIIGTDKSPFDDRVAARKALARSISGVAAT